MASSAISRFGYAIVVEGYMDVISVASAGITNIVASLGTAFTEEQAKLLMRYTRKIYFCYDSDEAGQRATIRAIPIAMSQGATVKVIIIPDGKDPDEYIKKHGAESFKKLVKQAISVIDYNLRYVLKTTDYSTIEGKNEAFKQMLPILASLSNEPVLQNEYCKRVASALIINEEILKEEVNKYVRNAKAESYRTQSANQATKTNEVVVQSDTYDTSDTYGESEQSEQLQSTSQDESVPDDKNNTSPESDESKDELSFANTKNQAIWTAGRFILKLAWRDNDTLSYSLSGVPKKAFPKLHQEIIDYINSCIENEKPLNDINAAKYLSEAALVELAKILIDNELDEQTFMNCYIESIKTMKLKWRKAEHAWLLQQAMKISKEQPDYMNKPEFQEIMNRSHKLKRQIAKLMLKS